MKSIFIVWGREAEHSKYLARALDSDLKQIYIKKIGNINLPVLFRYVWQTYKTILVLFKDRPEIVIVQNPPVFAPLVVLFYCKMLGARFMIDSHTSFLDKKWTYFHWLLKPIARMATLNTCHNFKNLEVFERWGVEQAMVMRPYNPDYNRDELNKDLENKELAGLVEGSFLPIIMVNRFAGDDDWQTVIETAKLMPEADFFITGSIPKNFNTKISDNIHLTGYLEHKEFIKLMWRCRMVLSLTLRKDTILWSIGEAMSLGKPFITSDTEVLRHYFGEVALFSKPNKEELKERIEKANENREQAKIKIKEFVKKEKEDWQEQIKKVKNIINNN